MESGGAAMAFLLWDKKIKIFLKKYLHFRKRWCILNESTAKSKRQINKWPVGQGVKTSPSHGENTGSIPVLAAKKIVRI